MNDSLVSIIVPAYNAEQYISECIDSVLFQDYQDWELIIVNDKSTDNTKNIVLNYIKVDKRIKLFNQPTNKGVSAARNRAIQESNGRFIAFLDSDDRWKKNKLSEQLKFMKENNYAFVFTSYETFETNSKAKKLISVPNKITYKEYLGNTIIGNLTVILDKRYIKNIFIPEGELEDVQTWMYYLKSGIIAYGLDKNLAEYRISNDSVSANKLKNAIKYYKLLRNTQDLSILQAIKYHISYSLNAIKKRSIKTIK